MDDDLSVYLAEEDDEPAGETGVWTILIADDEPDVHASTKFALGGATINGRKLVFIDAFTGKDAAEIVETQTIDLMFLDAIMESPTAGIECARKIRIDMHHDIPIIVMRSGFAGAIEQQLDSHMGVCIDEFMQKTNAGRQQLTDVLTKWLKER